MNRSIWTEPSVIVAKEKHDDRYLDATTVEAFQRSALALLRERFDEEYWYPSPAEDGDPPAIDLDAEAVELLPEDSLTRRLYEEQISRRNRWQKEHDRYVRWYEAAQRALAENDGALAWRCLEQRKCAEYESVSLERLESFK